MRAWHIMGVSAMALALVAHDSARAQKGGGGARGASPSGGARGPAPGGGNIAPRTGAPSGGSIAPRTVTPSGGFQSGPKGGGTIIQGGAPKGIIQGGAPKGGSYQTGSPKGQPYYQSGGPKGGSYQTAPPRGGFYLAAGGVRIGLGLGGLGYPYGGSNVPNYGSGYYIEPSYGVFPNDPGFVPTEPPVPTNGTAQIQVLLPNADGEVWFDGKKTRQVGTSRLFLTPALEPGNSYSYKIGAAWVNEEGTLVGDTRVVTITPGTTTIVDFTRPAPEMKKD